MIDRGQFEQTAAWLEYCDGMSRFEAETEAARRQGYKRHEVINANGIRNSQRGGDNRQAPAGHAEDGVSRLQSPSAQEIRPVSIGVILAGWGCLDVLALWPIWGSLV